MWVLTPIIRAGASQRPSDSASGDGARSGGAGPAPAATPNVNHFLTSGPLVIGRAGAGRSIDITIHGDGSVSGAHATLQLEAGPDGRSTVVITGGHRAASETDCAACDVPDGVRAATATNHMHASTQECVFVGLRPPA